MSIGGDYFTWPPVKAVEAFLRRAADERNKELAAAAAQKELRRDKTSYSCQFSFLFGQRQRRLRHPPQANNDKIGPKNRKKPTRERNRRLQICCAFLVPFTGRMAENAEEKTQNMGHSNGFHCPGPSRRQLLLCPHIKSPKRVRCPAERSRMRMRIFIFQPGTLTTKQSHCCESETTQFFVFSLCPAFQRQNGPRNLTYAPRLKEENGAFSSLLRHENKLTKQLSAMINGCFTGNNDIPPRAVPTERETRRKKADEENKEHQK